ncbi:hypothetical protein [Phyllobacterium bourgognense]|uniref:Uncharacterized protein n=1 Tax=Phyllobacterium bourgognense TaxID=314236 RepID=A0A368Z545_9HYPH|nr:hypothetical protein [Phyllobacterium bourgognense]RCW87570.1 hypothetical protein C7476_101336 [Phyllobacterium bourgognense]
MLIDHKKLEDLAWSIYSDGAANPVGLAVAHSELECEIDQDKFLEREFENQGEHTTAIYFCNAAAEAETTPVLVILFSGHHMTGLSQQFYGAFKDEETAYAALRKEFYLQGD